MVHSIKARDTATNGARHSLGCSMQQECPSASIMTRRFLTATLTVLASAFLGSCASLPDDAPVVENLDPQTGNTVARLGHPLELYRESGRSASGERFAFLGPFETNQAGTRQLFLWIALPMENPGGSATPTVL